MIDVKLHTPEGVKDYLPQELAFKTEIERRIETVFARYGFLPISSPTFEYMEVFQNKGSSGEKQMYKFLDRDGSVLALRSDMTPAIARIAATAYDESDIPLRFYYFENVFRMNEHYQGKLKEFTQGGIEVIGIDSVDADAEVIAVAVNSLIASGLKDFHIGIGHVQFFNAILEEAGFDEDLCLKIQDYMSLKDFVAVNDLVKETNASDGIKSFFEELPLLIGKKEIIERAKGFSKSEKALKALETLEEIYNVVKAYSLEKYIKIDLSIMGRFNYYTGVIFQGYAKGTGFSVISGGRYDKLVKNYGEDYPAVGFAIKINNLLSALESQKAEFEFKSASTLLAYTKEGRLTAVEAADEMRSKGMNIENSLLGCDIDKNIAYAKAKKMGGILYFSDNENVKLINVETNDIKDVKISELLKDK